MEHSRCNRCNGPGILPLVVCLLLGFADPARALDELPRLSVEVGAGQSRDLVVDLGRLPGGGLVEARIGKESGKGSEEAWRGASGRVTVGLISAEAPPASRWPEDDPPTHRELDLGAGENLRLRIVAHRCSRKGTRLVPIHLEPSSTPEVVRLLLPVEVRVTRPRSCTGVYAEGAVRAAVPLGIALLGVGLWSVAHRSSFLDLPELTRRLVPKDPRGDVQHASRAQLEDALHRQLPRERRAWAFLRWWLAHPTSSLPGGDAYTETVLLSLGRSTRLVSAALLGAGYRFEDLEADPRRFQGSLIARAGSGGRVLLYAASDREGGVGAWRLESPLTSGPGLRRLGQNDSLLPRDEGSGHSHEPENPLEPARWDVEGARGERS